MENQEEQKRTYLAGLYVRNLGASLIGDLTVGVLNIFTPLQFFQVLRAFFEAEGGWIIFIFLLLLVVFIAGLLQYLAQLPILTALNRYHRGEDIDEQLQEKAKARLLNLPFLLAFMTLIMWIGVSAFAMLGFELFTNVPSKISLFLLFRASMIGMIAATVSFFMVEDYSRKKLIPLFFPKGKLAALPGVLKVSILRRIRVLYMAGTSVPMIILVGTLFFTLWQVEDSPIPAPDLAREILIFTMILCGVFVILSLRLNFLVGKSILNPIGEMLGVVGSVRKGDFTTRINVLSNDEIGILGDAGNDMIAGLLEREKIRDAFGKYVTPEIRDEILAGRIPLNGERTEATLVFTDLRDFTPFVESNDPEEVINSMRAYFTAMQGIIRSHQGLVLQYVGDEVEAVFGVPIPCERHADRAVRAALEMRKALHELNNERALKGRIPFRHGVGIHTGEVLAGNTGSNDRLSYTLIGDTVNVASRIQGLTKEIPCDILLSEATAMRLQDAFHLEKEGARRVKGYSRPITVYRIP
jgi:adenylate cyclase